MICAYEDCNNEFEPKTHNQKYCSDECCKIATILKIKEKTQRARDKKAGKKFYCPKCKIPMSRYSNDDICENCKSKEIADERRALLEMLNGNRSTT